MYASLTNGFTFHYQPMSGTIGLWVHGKRIPRVNENDLTGGSRQFFRYGAYFIKAEYPSNHLRDYTQCKAEAYIAGRIKKRDKPFFAPLLACSDFEENMVHWTMFPWYNLSTEHGNSAELYQYSHSKVARLCDKYQIEDVAPYFNINWFIHKGRPLIVDCGITYNSEWL